MDSRRAAWRCDNDEYGGCPADDKFKQCGFCLARNAIEVSQNVFTDGEEDFSSDVIPATPPSQQGVFGIARGFPPATLVDVSDTDSSVVVVERPAKRAKPAVNFAVLPDIDPEVISWFARVRSLRGKYQPISRSFFPQLLMSTELSLDSLVFVGGKYYLYYHRAGNCLSYNGPTFVPPYFPGIANFVASFWHSFGFSFFEGFARCDAIFDHCSAYMPQQHVVVMYRYRHLLYHLFCNAFPLFHCKRPSYLSSFRVGF